MSPTPSVLDCGSDASARVCHARTSPAPVNIAVAGITRNRQGVRRNAAKAALLTIAVLDANHG